MLKISLIFKKFTNFTTNNSKILRIKNAKFSGYLFYVKTNIYGDFQICISVPLSSISFCCTVNFCCRYSFPLIIVYFIIILNNLSSLLSLESSASPSVCSSWYSPRSSLSSSSWSLLKISSTSARFWLSFFFQIVQPHKSIHIKLTATQLRWFLVHSNVLQLEETNSWMESGAVLKDTH